MHKSETPLPVEQIETLLTPLTPQTWQNEAEALGFQIVGGGTALELELQHISFIFFKAALLDQMPENDAFDLACAKRRMLISWDRPSGQDRNQSQEPITCRYREGGFQFVYRPEWQGTAMTLKVVRGDVQDASIEDKVEALVQVWEDVAEREPDNHEIQWMALCRAKDIQDGIDPDVVFGQATTCYRCNGPLDSFAIRKYFTGTCSSCDHALYKLRFDKELAELTPVKLIENMLRSYPDSRAINTRPQRSSALKDFSGQDGPYSTTTVYATCQRNRASDECAAKTI